MDNSCDPIRRAAWPTGYVLWGPYYSRIAGATSNMAVSSRTASPAG